MASNKKLAMNPDDCFAKILEKPGKIMIQDSGKTSSAQAEWSSQLSFCNNSAKA